MCRPFGDPHWVKDAAKRLGLECTVRPRGRPKKQSEAGQVYLFSLCSPDLVAVTFHLPSVDLPGEEADGFGEAADRIDIQSLDDGGLGGVGPGHKQPIAGLGGGLEGHREDSLDGPVSPVRASSPTMA